MKITFIGSGCAIPEPGKNYSCILLESSGKRYLIDIGCNPCSWLAKRHLTPDDITAVFLTHMHTDHSAGLIPFSALCSWRFKQADPEIYLPDMQMKNVIKDFLDCSGDNLRPSIRFFPVNEGTFYEDGIIRVTALRTGHTATSFAHQVECEGKKVLFAGDLTPGCGPEKDYARLVARESYDLTITECAHFSAMQYLDALQTGTVRKICITHCAQDRLPSVLQLRDALKDTQTEFILANDDLTIEL